LKGVSDSLNSFWVTFSLNYYTVPIVLLTRFFPCARDLTEG
jgi:hypothetical protein